MEKIIERSKCSGCHACLNICPKKAIYMEEDEKGFLYPCIDQDKCINCGICKKTCPILNVKKQENFIQEAYACYNKNECDRISSSSGGIFILLAKTILNKNGVVFGACFDKKFNIVHSYTENISDLYKFMGSKYSQSNIGNSFQKVKEFLNNDRYVLFSGTPCQIEGLINFLGKKYDKLYTQDIICHGVPSPRVWQKYLDFQEKKYDDKISFISFRNKEKSWTKYNTYIKFKKHIYNQNAKDDLYMKVFLSNICLRDSCYNCSFKRIDRLSDITLGDYWGVEKIHPDFFDDKGTSLLIINSKKGHELFCNINTEINYKKTNINDAIKYNSSYIKSANHCKNEKKFINNLNNIEFDKLAKKYIPKTSILKKISIKIKSIIRKLLILFKIKKV